MMITISFTTIFAAVMAVINIIVIPWAVSVNKRLNKGDTQLEVMKLRFDNYSKLEQSVEKLEKKMQEEIKEIKSDIQDVSIQVTKIPQQIAVMIKEAIDG